jgi:BASS family bile acid:Na+ symporter
LQPKFFTAEINAYKIILSLGVLSLIAAIVMRQVRTSPAAGPFLIAFFLALAIGFRGSALLKGLSFTVTIFAAVTTALYYPNYFVDINGFKLSSLITPLLQLIMFGMGTSMSFKILQA